MRPAGVVSAGEGVQEGLQLDRGGGLGDLGVQPLLQCLLEPFHLALGLRVVRPAVLLGDAQAPQLGQADRFTAAPQLPPGTLKIADLPSDPEPDAPGRAATPEVFTELLGTALFDAAVDAAVGPMMAIASLNRTRGPESWGGDSEL